MRQSGMVKIDVCNVTVYLCWSLSASANDRLRSKSNPTDPDVHVTCGQGRILQNVPGGMRSHHWNPRMGTQLPSSIVAKGGTVRGSQLGTLARKSEYTSLTTSWQSRNETLSSGGRLVMRVSKTGNDLFQESYFGLLFKPLPSGSSIRTDAPQVVNRDMCIRQHEARM